MTVHTTTTIATAANLKHLISLTDGSLIHTFFESYLKPFTTNEDTRLLAKTFLQFLADSLNLINNRLNQTPNHDSHDPEKLFKTYKLCLECLEAINSHLEGKPYMVQAQRVKLIRCLLLWGRIQEAKAQGLYALKFISDLNSCGGTRSGVPKLGNNTDKDLALLIVDIVGLILKCVATQTSNDEESVVDMVIDLKPWLRTIDKDLDKKFHKSLVTHLIAFGLRICKSLERIECRPLLDRVLGVTADSCMLLKETDHVRFLQFVAYCANRSQVVDACGAVAHYFNKVANGFAQVNLWEINLIMRLYAISLYSYSLAKAGKEIISKILLDTDIELQKLTTVHGGYLLSKSNNGMSNENSLGLKFLCTTLAKLIISKIEDIIVEFEDNTHPTKLHNIEDAFQEFRLVYSDRDVYTSGTQLSVVVAAWSLSFFTKKDIEARTKFLKDLISTDCLQAKSMKFLYSYMSNVGFVFYRRGQLRMAAVSFELCCHTMWSYIISLCKTFSSSNESPSDLSEDSIIAFAQKTCATSAAFLDILHQCGCKEMSRTLIDFLEKWSVAHSLFEKMPSPVDLVKQWVKIKCKEVKVPEARHSVTTINFLMSSSSKISKEALTILSKQEVEAYMEFNSLNQNSNFHPKEICNTKDSFLQKSRILITNARESRARGIEGLNDSIKYLSEAISLMGDTYNKEEYARDLLFQAYCLRTLCTQEAEPNSKVFVQDISNALKLWLSLEHSQSAEQTRIVPFNTLTLLYHVGDLLSLKGYMEDHSDIYEMMFRFFIWKNVPLKEWVTIFWQSRSLSHCLCTSPVSDAFIMTLSKYCELSKSMEFWISCMETSESLKVGFRQSLSVISTLSSPDSLNHEHIVRPLATVADVKQAASDLISNDPPSSKALFLAAHLYYDLCERVIAKGSMIEGLSYAKEAHLFRTKILARKFMYSVEKDDAFGDNGELIQKHAYEITSFHMHPLVATSAWSHDSDLVEFILTPWNVLKSYLESILQLGTIEEIVGNGSEAEYLLTWGKNISVFHGLPIFSVSFSYLLGKLYRKRGLWHLAAKELESAKSTLDDSSNFFGCVKCKMVLQATVDEQLGDLHGSHTNNTTGNQMREELSKAETLYRSAVDQLKQREWKNIVSHNKKESGKLLCDAFITSGVDVNIPSDSGINQTEKEEIRPKVTKKGKKTANPLEQEQRVGSSKQRSETAQNEVQNVILRKKGQKSKVGCITSCVCEVTCAYENGVCWYCLSWEVMQSLSMEKVIQMKWEIARRRLLLRLHTKIGKCLRDIEETQRAHDVFLESISVLVSRSTFRPSRFSLSYNFLADLIIKNVTTDVFAVEYASLLYSICWFSLRSSWDKGTRNDCDDSSRIPMPTVVSGLKLSFILCREVPELFQKVSRLLSVIYTLSPSNKDFCMVATSQALCESQWASYFHQASLGPYINYHLFSHLGKATDKNTMDVEGSSVSSLLSLHRLAPESVMDLEEFVIKFFHDLPGVTIVCISILGKTVASILKDLLRHKYSAPRWIMISRLNSNNAPVVVALPLDSLLEGSKKEDEGSRPCILSRCDKSWHCPWDHTIIDDVAPLFREILEESYGTTSGCLEDCKENRLLWWDQRKKLDQCLGDLLRDMEDLWFGPWKYLLLGGLLNCKHLDSVTKKLMKDLKSKCKVNINESILRSLISGAFSRQKECFLELLLNKGCYIGGKQCDNDSRPGETSDSLSSLVSDFLKIHGIGDDLVDREPVILVPDFDIQMLPWESMPLLRNQEVYRMPSIASISCTYDRCCQIQQKVVKDLAVFPMIDPLDAYYLLNPSGDLRNTEFDFGAWFKDQNLEGTIGTSPTEEELIVALETHDLFIYVGHGSGLQYISGGEIQKLTHCAATFLMGCSSGCMHLNGSYTPKGAPLYYLFAGSPFTIANLWDVTDKDIDRFGKAMFNALMKVRSTTSMDCAQCTEIADKSKEVNIDKGRRKGKKKISKSNSVEVIETNSSTFGCRHRPKIGSFMGNARQACELPFLIGAAPVCYGIPTGIMKKKL